MTPKLFTTAIRETFGGYPANSHGCLKFADILKGIFGGERYYNGDHFVVKIEDRYYDLFGDYGPDDTVRYMYGGSLQEFPISDFLHEDEFGQHHLHKSFNI